MNLLLPVVDTNSIGWTFNPPTDASAAVFVQASVTVTTGGIMLVNDSTSPGTTRYYGTDGGGVKGFFTFPVASAVTGLHVQSNPSLQGDVTLIQGANVTLTQSGQNITIQSFSSITSAVTAVHVQGQVALAGDVQFIQGSNVTLTQGAGTITVAAAGAPAIADGIEFVIDGGGATITTGVKGDLSIPFNCTITKATLLADQSGSVVVNIWKDTYANYPPTVADKITASAPPTITSATNSQDSTLTGWTKSITAGDTLRFNVDSCTTIQRVTLALDVTR